MSRAKEIRDRVHEIIFEADTPAGKAFDVGLLIAIVSSVMVVMLESVKEIREQFASELQWAEWIFTALFTVEYLLRIYSVQKPHKYIFSFYGIVDLLAILPSFLQPFVAGSRYLVTIRTLRLLRIFRVLKLANYVVQGQVISRALRASRAKITVFLIAVMTLVVIVGSIMYVIEGGEESQGGFTSIPRSIYWAIVTVTTVGYGDIAPVSDLGQALSAVLMIMGYGIIAVPTGIVSVELTQAQKELEAGLNTISCPVCSREGHDNDATFCKYCGGEL
ncbi:MAG: ion transporter [Bacteroidota bacterium]